jgi:hypothetical protein
VVRLAERLGEKAQIVLPESPQVRTDEQIDADWMRRPDAVIAFDDDLAPLPGDAGELG